MKIVFIIVYQIQKLGTFGSKSHRRFRLDQFDNIHLLQKILVNSEFKHFIVTHLKYVRARSIR